MSDMLKNSRTIMRNMVTGGAMGLVGNKIQQHQDTGASQPSSISININLNRIQRSTLSRMMNGDSI